MFRGVRSYQEVLNQVRALLLGEMVGFYNFQKHRKRGLPKVLQGKSLKSLDTQQAKTQNPEVGSSAKQETLENHEKVEVSTQKGSIPEIGILDNQGKDKKETIIKNKEDKPSSSPRK